MNIVKNFRLYILRTRLVTWVRLCLKFNSTYIMMFLGALFTSFRAMSCSVHKSLICFCLELATLICDSLSVSFDFIGFFAIYLPQNFVKSACLLFNLIRFYGIEILPRLFASNNRHSFCLLRRRGDC